MLMFVTHYFFLLMYVFSRVMIRLHDCTCEQIRSILKFVIISGNAGSAIAPNKRHFRWKIHRA